MKIKILNTIKNFTPDAKDVLKDLGDVDYLNVDQDGLLEKISEYNILIIGIGLDINKKIINNAGNLELIVTATTGLDHIDLEYAKMNNIKVISLKGEDKFLDSITGTSELAFSLMICLMRLIVPSFNSMLKYEFDRERFKGHNLSGNTLGVVGLGRLGKQMVKFVNAFDMNVIVHDPYIEKNIFKKFNCKRVSFETLIKESDVISIHIHLNNETEGMFNKKTFQDMKNTTYLINTSRGKIVNENELLYALENHIIAGYGTDVLADETSFHSNFNNHALIEYAKNHENCLILPHTGGMTFESREATDIFIAKKLVDEINNRS
jgi:D-3-phosphoglycerate dehydrogenase / 2-oxoglutarate reductase